MNQPIPNPAYDPAAERGAALEVTAVLGDSVLAVRHLDPSPSPASRRPAYALFGVGALLLALSATTFAHGVSVAAENERALARFLAEERRPIHEFRPRRLGVGHDLAGLGGLAGGLVAIGIGLARLRSRRPQNRFAIGRDRAADFAMDDVPVERFELVTSTGGGPRVRAWRGMTAELATPAETLRLDEMAAKGLAVPSGDGAFAIDLPREGKIALEAGLVRFFVRWVPAPRREPFALRGSFERRAGAFLVASAAAHLALLGLLQGIPPDGHMLGLDQEERGGRLAKARFAPSEPPEREPEESGGEEAGEGKKPSPAVAQGKKGAVGEPDETATAGRAAIKERAEEPQLARHQAMERARHSGIAGAMAARSDLFTSLTSQNPFSSGLDAEDVRGGAYGDEVAAIHGPYGSEWGNAVTDLSDTPYWRDGIIRAGELPGGRPWGDPRYGGGADLHGSRPDRPAKTPTVATGPATVPPEWDPAIIRRHIRRNLRRVRHCYEKELLASPELSGTALVRFTITAEGRVLGARASGMNNEALHGCIAGVVASIQFPRSPNGAAANVRYPFHLRQSGR